MKYRTKGTCSSAIDIELDNESSNLYILREAAMVISRVFPAWWKECPQKRQFPV